MMTFKLSLLFGFCLYFTATISQIGAQGTAKVPIENHANWYLFDHENCGFNVDADRIIGGNKASLGEYPWMARIGYTRNSYYDRTTVDFKCGGALINNIYVLTAAHCLVDQPKESLLALVRIGEFSTKTDIDCEDGECAPFPQDILPEELIVHHKFDEIPFKNDVALIRLKTPVNFHKYVRPICLPRGNLMTKHIIGSTMEVAGWGVYDIQNPQMNHHLYTVRIPILNIQNCAQAYEGVTSIGQGQICAGGVVNKDSCGGDSGGPLMRPDQASDDSVPQFFVYGIVSFGSPKCGSPIPAVYTNVRLYLTWILDNVRP